MTHFHKTNLKSNDLGEKSIPKNFKKAQIFLKKFNFGNNFDNFDQNLLKNVIFCDC